jgi:hypothetical protein
MTADVIDLDERLFQRLLTFDFPHNWDDERAGAEMGKLLARMRELTSGEVQLVYAWFGVAEDDESYEKLNNLGFAAA